MQDTSSLRLPGDASTIDILASIDEVTIGGVDIEASTTEFDIGVRKVWEVAGSTVRPYIGDGIAFIGAEIKETSFTNISVNDDGAVTGLLPEFTGRLARILTRAWICITRRQTSPFRVLMWRQVELTLVPFLVITSNKFPVRR